MSTLSILVNCAIWLLCLLIALCFWILNRFNYWKSQGVPGPEPIFPVGNIKEMVTGKLHGGHQFQKLYLENKQHKYIGVYMFYRTTFMVNDLEMVKTFLVRDFVHFMDHTLPYNKKYEPLGGHLFNAKGSKWKGIRGKLTPAFTSNKMKYMFETMAECGDDLKNHLQADAVTGAEVDIKDVMAKFTTDIIVSCALGIESKSLMNPDAEFRKIGQKLMSLDFRKGMVVFLNMFAPQLINYLPLAFTDKDVSDFFIDAIYAVIKHREENNVQRNDLMQLLIKLKNNQSIDENEDDKTESSNVQLDRLEIAAEAFGFFVAGFETSSTATSCMLFELGKNPEIQNKLRQEINDVLLKHDGKITYESLTEMTYMTQVIEESLRMYPPIPHIFRMCTKDYNIADTDIVLKVGSRVVVSILGIHYDPDIYPDPKKFDPERFTPENKLKRHNYAFLPFGEGPRICIGLRFALMQIRIALVSTLKHYEVFNLNGKDEEMIYEKKSIFMSPKDLKLRFKKII